VRGIGRTGSVAVDLSDTNIVYATASGVLWRSADNGISWAAYVDSAEYFPVSFVWVDPLHGDTLYVVSNGQLFKSTDEGHSWIQLVTGAGALNSFKMLIDPVNTQRLLLITTTINQSLDGGLSKSENDGLTFVDRSNGIGNAIFYSIACSRSDTSVFMAGALDDAQHCSIRPRAGTMHLRETPTMWPFTRPIRRSFMARTSIPTSVRSMVV
jgi:hypothetical protein